MEYTRQTLEETPERVLQFLAAVGTNAGLRGILASRGYGDTDHAQGWKLLHAATGFEVPQPVPAADRSAAAAAAEIDSWDEPNFRLARATLARHFPEQAAFVFHQLEPGSGAASLLSVRTLLDRLDALDGSRPGRDHKDKARKKADGEAVALLDKRGITTAERARLRKLLAQTESGAKPDPHAQTAQASADAQGEKRAATQVELRAWYDEWSEVARIVITRRDYLIRLGLAKRKPSKKDPDPSPPDDPNDPSDS